MQALELKIPPLVLVALFALVMWLLAHLVPPLALPSFWGLVLAEECYISPSQAGTILSQLGSNTKNLSFCVFLCS